ncbi:uncharacterized protein LOC114353412 [Ostrinia furnacalis]|uniref:uncharacterized protein LOC114353412 n=1 Tax=Ostrinia furnacalis TaxID=93504 RepID=UPI00103E219D|nr:uncharacterized protein LOC114353412 [Ostrinia furnacalis]
MSTSSTTHILEEKPKDTYYADINDVEDLPRRRWSIGDDWRASTTLWLLVLALLLWLATYLMTVLVAVYFDCGVRSVVSLTTLLGWNNGTSIVSLDENTKFIVTY